MTDATNDTDPNTERLMATHARLVTENDAKNAILQAKGVIVTREGVEAKRNEFILDWLFPPGTFERLEVEVGWQEYIKAQLELIHSNVLAQEREARKPGIMVPVTKRIILPGEVEPA